MEVFELQNNQHSVKLKISQRCHNNNNLHKSNFLVINEEIVSCSLMIGTTLFMIKLLEKIQEHILEQILTNIIQIPVTVTILII